MGKTAQPQLLTQVMMLRAGQVVEWQAQEHLLRQVVDDCGGLQAVEANEELCQRIVAVLPLDQQVVIARLQQITLQGPLM